MRVAMQRRLSRQAIAGALIAGLGLLLTLGAVAAYSIGSWTEWRDRGAFENLSYHNDVARNMTPGTALAVLTIPRVGLSVLVRAGVTQTVLSRGAGWVPGTALPGEQGNSAIAAHRDTFFRDLKRISAGDVVTVEANGVLERYLVKRLSVVEPTSVEVLRPTEHSALTLITCYPFNYLGSAPKRFIVRADRIS